MLGFHLESAATAVSRSRHLMVLVVLCGCLAGLAPIASAEQHKSSDPWEKTNRKIFAFNEKVDQWALAPLAKGWDFVIPELVQTGIRNFFHNLYMPITLVNDILQLKPGPAAQDIVRIVVNTTFGIGGFIDVASWQEIPKNDENFGQTLGHYGVPPGPYLVWPFLGSSNPRQTFGLVVDTATLPHQYFVPIYVTWGSRGLELLNRRAFYLEEVAQSRRDAFDFYIFVRNAYNQNLANKVHGSSYDEESEDDLYFDADDDDYDY